jgi:predicted nucleotidyltransferase/biotin operon repressor
MAFLTTPLDHVLGSTSKIRVLRLLVQQDRILSAREISRLTGMSRTAILAAIEDLAKLGIILKDESGRQFLCRANRNHKLVQIALAPLFQAEVKWPELVIAELSKVLGVSQDGENAVWHSHNGILAAWIFGSVAQGRDRPESDLDLFVLTDTEDQAESVIARFNDAGIFLKKELGADIKPIAMSYERARSQFQRGNPLIKNAIHDARMVFGEIPEELLSG